jgi:hypothetical protein
MQVCADVRLGVYDAYMCCTVGLQMDLSCCVWPADVDPLPLNSQQEWS